MNYKHPEGYLSNTSSTLLHGGRSKSIDLDVVAEVAKVNPSNAILLLVLYLKLEKERSDKLES